MLQLVLQTKEHTKTAIDMCKHDFNVTRNGAPVRGWRLQMVHCWQPPNSASGPALITDFMMKQRLHMSIAIHS
jgi:hypothetical protein